MSKKIGILLNNKNVDSKYVVSAEEYDEVYAKECSYPAKIRPAVYAAIDSVMKGINNDYGAAGYLISSQSEYFPVVEASEITSTGKEFPVAAFFKKDMDGKLIGYACRKDGHPYIIDADNNNGTIFLVLLIVNEIIKGNDEEFKEEFKKIALIYKQKQTIARERELLSSVAVLSDNLTRRVVSKKSDSIDFEFTLSSGAVRQISAKMLSSGRLKPKNENIIYGKFKIVDNQDKIKDIFGKEVAGLKFNRKWTEEEKQMIPEIPEWYIMPQEVSDVCTLISESTSSVKPKRNFMFRGPSSTGKTSMARAIASKLGMPYMFITCSSDTESSAFLGEPMYDKDGNVKYVESPFIKAIKNGYLIEIQEPYVISKQGVLTALNGLLDDSAGVTLATGEFVKRHPDCVVIFTTNVSYVGCKKPNQSVLRRMNGVYDVNTPDVPVICQRVKANTNFEDNKMLTKMVQCAKKIENHLKNEMIDDGVCGVSEIIDWVSTYQIIDDIVEAARSTIVSKATDDALEQANIMAIVEAEFE